MKSKKGSGFEREICRTLSLWWSENKRDDVFWRSSGSGARAKVRSKQGKITEGQHGDIAATHPSGKKLIDLFTLELKRGYSKFTIYDVVDKNPDASMQEWEKWFEQITLSQSQSKTLGWMIIHRRDRRIPFIFFSFSIYQKMFNQVSRIKRPYILMYLKIRNSKGKKKNTSVFGCSLENFLKTISPSVIKSLWQDERNKKKERKRLRRELAEIREAKKLSKTQKTKNKDKK